MPPSAGIFLPVPSGLPLLLADAPPLASPLSFSWQMYPVLPLFHSPGSRSDVASSSSEPAYSPLSRAAAAVLAPSSPLSPEARESSSLFLMYHGLIIGMVVVMLLLIFGSQVNAFM
jgi:hypothetical protein